MPTERADGEIPSTSPQDTIETAATAETPAETAATAETPGVC
jgi:hypothetical protein